LPGGGGAGGSFKRPNKIQRKFKYNPSLVGVHLGLKGKKPKSSLTGLEIRKIIT